jgi:hypothetical protein
MKMKMEIGKVFLLILGLALFGCEIEYPNDWELTETEKKWVEQSEVKYSCEIEPWKGTTYDGMNDIQDSTCSITIKFPVGDSSLNQSKLNCIGVSKALSKEFSSVIEEKDGFQYVECWCYKGEHKGRYLYTIRTDSIVEFNKKEMQ